MALGSALLASAALLLHSFVKVLDIDRGYEVDHVLSVDLALFGENYSKGPQQVAFYRTLTDNIRALHGVRAAGAIAGIPATGDVNGQTIFLDTDTDFEKLVLARPVGGFRQVTQGYFAASGTTLLAGRFFNEQDRVSTAIVSESLAKLLWPNDPLERVIGRRIRQGDVARTPLVTVVGVVSNVRGGAPDQNLLTQIYRPYLPPLTGGRMTVIARTTQ